MQWSPTGSWQEPNEHVGENKHACMGNHSSMYLLFNVGNIELLQSPLTLVGHISLPLPNA